MFVQFVKHLVCGNKFGDYFQQKNPNFVQNYRLTK